MKNFEDKNELTVDNLVDIIAKEIILESEEIFNSVKNITKNIILSLVKQEYQEGDMNKQIQKLMQKYNIKEEDIEVEYNYYDEAYDEEIDVIFYTIYNNSSNLTNEEKEWFENKEKQRKNNLLRKKINKLIFNIVKRYSEDISSNPFFNKIWQKIDIINIIKNKDIYKIKLFINCNYNLGRSVDEIKKITKNITIDSFEKITFYHGTSAEIEKIEPKYMFHRNESNAALGVGTYFTNNINTAQGYAKDKAKENCTTGKIYKVEVGVNNLRKATSLLKDNQDIFTESKIVKFLTKLKEKYIEDFYYLITDYGIEIYNPEDIEMGNIIFLTEKMMDEEIRNFQITLAQYFGSEALENISELWVENFDLDGTYTSFHENNNSPKEVHMCLINPNYEIILEEEIDIEPEIENDFNEIGK